MNEKTLKITDLLALILFGVFAVCVFLVILTGASIYRNLVAAGERSYIDRTVSQYITTRVRQAEMVSVEEFDGCSAMVSAEEIDGEIYLTRVYCYDGYLRELFCAADADLRPEDGEKLLAVENAVFSMKGSVLSATVDMQELILTVRTGKGAAP